MFARAIIVLLVILNLGVALWWLARPAGEEETAIATAQAAPRLFLLSEVPARQRPSAARTRPSATPGAEPAVGQAVADTDAAANRQQRCFAFGPFADAAAASRARELLASPDVRRMRTRQVATGARGWNVSLPPLADRAAATAMAARLREAGIDDLFILSSGESANGIALGRYGSESSARQRVSALKAAGFDAAASPIGDVDAQHWIDVTAASGFDVANARQTTGAARAESRQCASQP